MPRGFFGVFIGFALAFALMFGNFGYMVVVAAFGAIGYLVQKVVDGDIDISRYLGNRNSK